MDWLQSLADFLGARQAFQLAERAAAECRCVTCLTCWRARWLQAFSCTVLNAVDLLDRIVYSIMECGVVVLAVNTAVVDADQPRNVGTTPIKMATTCRLLLRTRPC